MSKKAVSTINTMQRTVYNARIAVSPYGYGVKTDIHSYDLDNMYPDKCRAIAQRSGSLSTALDTLTRFLSGLGFEQNGDLIIDQQNTTLNEFLLETAAEFAAFGAAIHVKYNAFGEQIAVELLRWEQVRKGVDGTFRIMRTWDPNEYYWNENEEVTVKPFNPETAKSEIDEIGFENYTGQLLYSFRGVNVVYPLARYDAVLDDAQIDATTKIFGLSNMQNEFTASGLLRLPT